MADSFFQRFAQKLGIAGGPKSHPVLIDSTVFGKHPAWNDHIPELSPDHARLVELKRILYEGITGNVDNGEWDKLQKTGRLQPYGHSLLWTAEDDCIVGRCWYSKDGKGRDRYPMIATILCQGVPLEWTVREAFPILQDTQAQCSAATTAQGVSAAVESAELKLKQLARLESLDQISQGRTPAQASTDLASHPALGPDRVGFFRVLYHLERELSQQARSANSKPLAGRGVTLRVPLCAETPTNAVETWTRFLRSKVNADVPVLVIVPDSGAWVDAIVGPASVSQLFCFRAPLEVLPFTTDIPYSIDPAFVQRAGKMSKMP